MKTTHPEERLRSNSPALFIGFGVLFAMGLIAHHFQARLNDRTTMLIVSIGFSMPFLLISLFELRSGYTWRNLTPGNRGISRSESPLRFFGSVAFHALLGLAILGCSLWGAFAR